MPQLNLDNSIKGMFIFIMFVSFIFIFRNLAELIRLRRKNRVMEIDLMEKKIHEKVSEANIDDLVVESNKFHRGRRDTTH